MFTKFLSLNADKQAAILNAALAEFASKCYKNASTNQIVKDAGISKGMLFHYFNNKKDLYFFLYDHFVDMFTEELQKKVDWNEKDIFIRNRQMAALKIRLFITYPQMFDFLKTIFREEDPAVKEELDIKAEKFMNQDYKEMLNDIDTSKFRSDIDVKNAVDIITWSMEGFAYRQQAQVEGLTAEQIHFEAILHELDAYIETLKNAFYK